MNSCRPVIRMAAVRAVFLNAAACHGRTGYVFRAPEIVFSLPVPAD